MWSILGPRSASVDPEWADDRPRVAHAGSAGSHPADRRRQGTGSITSGAAAGSRAERKRHVDRLMILGPAPSFRPDRRTPTSWIRGRLRADAG
jgi:hypothetical protein